MDGNLRVGGFGHIQAIADGRRGCTPIFMQLEPNHPCIDLLVQGCWQ